MRVIFEIAAKDFQIAEELARAFLSQSDRFGFGIIEPLISRTARTHVDKYPGLSGIFYKLSFFVTGVTSIADQKFLQFLERGELNSSFTLLEPKIPSAPLAASADSSGSKKLSAVPEESGMTDCGITDLRKRELGISTGEKAPGIPPERKLELGLPVPPENMPGISPERKLELGL